MNAKVFIVAPFITCFLHLEPFVCSALPADWRSRFHASVLDTAEREVADGHLSTSNDIIWAEGTSGFKMESKRTGLMLPNNYWPQGGKCIPYKIHSAFGSEIQRRIRTALVLIKNCTHSCITFKEHTNETEYISIQRGRHCQSEIGRTPGQRTKIKLGSGCITQGIILHELLHALGLYHEQNRPDRDHYVEMFPDNIQSGQYDLNFAILPNMSDYGTQYDMESTCTIRPLPLPATPTYRP